MLTAWKRERKKQPSQSRVEGTEGHAVQRTDKTSQSGESWCQRKKTKIINEATVEVSNRFDPLTEAEPIEANDSPNKEIPKGKPPSIVFAAKLTNHDIIKLELEELIKNGYHLKSKAYKHRDTPLHIQSWCIWRNHRGSKRRKHKVPHVQSLY